MKCFSLIFLLSMILVGCNTVAPAATATATPRPTATEMPTAMPTATPTETPFPVSAEWKEILGENYTVMGDGKIRDEKTGKVIPELEMLFSGVFRMVYEFDGDPSFKIVLNSEFGDIKVLANGDLDLPGWVWSSNLWC
jgi:hypothetical protein